MYRRILVLVRPYWKHLTGGVLLSMVNVFFQTLTLWLSASFITTIFSSSDPSAPSAEKVIGDWDLNERLKEATREIFFSGDQLDALQTLGIVILLSYLIKSLAYYGNAILTGIVQARVVRDLRARLYEHYVLQPLQFFQSRRSGDLISLAMNDVMRVNHALATTFRPLIVEPLYIIAYLTLLFVIDWQLTLISLLVIPVTTFFIVLISRSIRRKVIRVQQQLGEITSRFSEMIGGIRIIKAFVNENTERKRFHGEAGYLYKLMFRLVRLQTLSTPVTEMLGVTMAVVLLWVGGQQVLRYETITSEDFLRFIVLLFSIYQPIRNLAKVNIGIQTGIAAGSRIFEMLDIEPAIKDSVKGADLPPFADSIEFENVSFKYSNSDLPAVKHIDLRIPKGNVIALVGPSGSGKSTLVDLIPRFHDITEGTIRIDGQDIRGLTRRSFRSQIGIVSQDTILFNDTVANNIAYGIESAPQAIQEAAEQANAHEFISVLPEAYDTMIGERGARLSGGQRQRIAIARALLKDPAILILDEATSALDTESEKLVQNAIDRLMKGRTVIVIAHRLSTILNADEILVMEDGRIIERGNHQDLKNSGGLYQKLYELQFAEENDQNTS